MCLTLPVRVRERVGSVSTVHHHLSRITHLTYKTHICGSICRTEGLLYSNEMAVLARGKSELTHLCRQSTGTSLRLVVCGVYVFAVHTVRQVEPFQTGQLLNTYYDSAVRYGTESDWRYGPGRKAANLILWVSGRLMAPAMFYSRDRY